MKRKIFTYLVLFLILGLQSAFGDDTNILKQGSFKAEYISNNYDYNVSDYIKVTLDKKEYILPGVFNKDDKTKLSGINCIKEGLKKDPSLSNKDAWERCLPTFGGFDNFSPSGYYLQYTVSGWEYAGKKLVDSTTGKEFINIDYVTFTGWTKDKKQFIYGRGSDFAGASGLYITIKGSFPKVKKIIDDFIDSGYINTKENKIYLKTHNFVNTYNKDGTIKSNKEVCYKKVVDLKTLKITSSKKSCIE